MTDLPDAETAWEAWRETHALPHWDGHGVSRAIFDAGFSAASGPWAEHLDAARAEADELFQRLHGSRAELDAALARNAELEKQYRLDHAERDDARRRRDAAEATATALRAELDNLRDRLTALADKWELAADPGKWTSADELRAIVRGSDDE